MATIIFMAINLLKYPISYPFLPPPPPSSNAGISPFRAQSRTTNQPNSTLTFSGTTTTTTVPAEDKPLLSLLHHRKTEEAWQLYSQTTHLPSGACLSRLVAQLSCLDDNQDSLSRAQSIFARLRHDQQLHRLDAYSLGLLAVCAAKSGNTHYGYSIINLMIRSDCLPHVKAWSAIVSRLAASADDGPWEAISLFDSIVERVRRVKGPRTVADSVPDTRAFNGVLNACANIGDVRKFVAVFDEMPKWNVMPDVFTYNVMIKLCARVNRKDLVVNVLELMLYNGVEPCMTTMRSLVAAYVGFGDLETAEQLVQAMSEGRRDVCKILRELNSVFFDEYGSQERNENGLIEKLIPDLIGEGNNEPPLMPKAYAPDTKICTTLMKGYMNAGRVADTVRMLEAMRHQIDSSLHPDHVSYTTVISAHVKAKSMDKAHQVLAEMMRIGVPVNLVTYNIMLKGYCQQLQFVKAKELVQDMVDAGILPDVVSYNTLIDGCILVDDGAGALACFNEMRARGITPTKISYTTLMKAFAFSRQPKLAHKVFDEMLKDPMVKVDQAAWNMLVEGYCKLGLVEEAKKVVQKMKENGLYPNVSTYGSLANGIALAKKPGEALLLWNEIKERWQTNKGQQDPNSTSMPPLKPDKELLYTLADICVRAAFFKKALEVVVCMEENGISPDKAKYNRIYVEMHSRMFTSKHASKARQDRRKESKRAAEAFKFWLGLQNSYYESEWRPDSSDADDYDD